MPRPATIRISVATMGWMPSTATRKPFQSPHRSPAASASGIAAPRPQPWSTAKAARGPADRHHRAHGQVDPARGDDQRHADGQERHGRAALEHVDGAAHQPVAAEADGQEAREERP